MEDFDFIDIENGADDAEAIAEAQKAIYAEMDAQRELDAWNAAQPVVDLQAAWGDEAPF